MLSSKETNKYKGIDHVTRMCGHGFRKKCLSISNQDEGMYGIFIHSLNGYNTLQIKI